MSALHPTEVFTFSNILVLPAWFLLIVVPRWKWTRVIAAYITPTLLAVAWLLIAMTRPAPIGGGFGSLDQVVDLVRDPWFVVMGWTHTLILDLFLGAWETRDAQRLGIRHAYVIPCLILTFLAGPVGLIGYFVVRVAIVRRWPWKPR